MGGMHPLEVSSAGHLFICAVIFYTAGWILGGSRPWNLIPHALVNGLGVLCAGACALPLAFLFGYASSYDQRTMEVPEWVFACGCLFWCATGGMVSRREGIAGCLAALIVGIGLQQYSRIHLGDVAYGGADVKLGCLFGLYGGAAALTLGLFLGSLSALFSSALQILGRRLRTGDAIPFVPSLSSGLMGSLLLIEFVKNKS